jgi:hypothetical protein
MEIQQQLAFELRERIALLPNVITELKTLADKDVNGMGIHQSQIDTVKAVLDKIHKDRSPLLEKLNPELPHEVFMQTRTNIETFLTSSNSIMATFRYIFAQRDDSPDDKKMLDIADLVAAYCYKACMEMANNWRGLPLEYYREPPLTYLNAMLSPAAISRRHDLKQIGLKLYTDTENRLPISVISLPFHDTVAIWTFCSLYHEVGHLLDNDLGLRDELTKAVLNALKENNDSDAEAVTRQTLWEFWMGEMLADAFGVLIGGAAYGYSLLGMLFRSNKEVGELSGDKHPNEHVRAHLLASLLKQTGVEPLAGAAAQITDLWSEAYGEIPSLEPHVNECDVVAHALLTTKLDALKNKEADSQTFALIDFGYNLAVEHKKIEALAGWLLDQGARPEPKNYSFRLIPAAAQLAVTGVTSDFVNRYQSIQQKTLAYLQEVPHDRFLAGPNTPARQQYLDRLIGDVSFTATIEDESQPTALAQ